MQENILYFNNLNVVDKNKNSYCIDMLRLKCNITIETFEKNISSRFVTYRKFINSWKSNSIEQFYQNYQYKDEFCSFWFGFMSNKEISIEGRNKNKKFNLTIEFNPNKVKDNKLLLAILKCSLEWEIIRADFAFDIRTNILNITGFDKSKKKCLKIFDNGGDDKTYYIGEKNNSVKIYNKKNEAFLSYDLTRIEITKCFKNLSLRNIKEFNFTGYFPRLYLNDYQISIDDINIDGTLSAIIFAVNNGFPLHDLTRKYREKVINFMQEKKPIEVDFYCFTVAFLNYLSYYFSFINFS